MGKPPSACAVVDRAKGSRRNTMLKQISAMRIRILELPFIINAVLLLPILCPNLIFSTSVSIREINKYGLYYNGTIYCLAGSPAILIVSPCSMSFGSNTELFKQNLDETIEEKAKACYY